jgi:hypothetical protein
MSKDIGTPRRSTRPGRAETSRLLDELLVAAPQDHVTLHWLVTGLGDRSFGIVIILLAVLALLPGVSGVVGMVLTVPAYQMIRAQPGPVFPKKVAGRPFSTQLLAKLLRRVVPILRWLERFIHPRWRTPFEATKRVVGGAVILLAGLLLVPIPLSNLVPAAVILVIAIAYLEEDGLLLCLGLGATVLVLAMAAASIWEALSAAGWVPSFL